jgi:adenylate kinase
MTGRSDDTEDSIKVRFEVYKKDTQPLVDFYNEKNLVNVIDAVGEVEDIYNSISRHFK